MKFKEMKFLQNEPLGEDLFQNKSQEKIASVISKQIINRTNFSVIGIDGEWGSGKSNLIKLIESELRESHEFFIYDVWGHQEDEQRRSILVELTDFIKNKKGLLKACNKKQWDNKLKSLLVKSKEVTTINQPYLSIGFIFSLLSIVYVPTVNVFKDSMTDYFGIESWFWKLVLIIFPIFIVFGIYLWNLIKNWCKKNGFIKSFRLSAEETFQVYTNKQKEETKIETISENQPSVRDFQNWMDDINKDLNKPIIIVFDNFDRLPKKHIISIWSSIHVFFSEKKYSNIKVIVPFDREHVQNAFKELNSDVNKFGDDYINKTFDIVFRLTPPIMSNWKKFFEEQWNKAFNDVNDNELKATIQVYEFLCRKITPREIISFINEVITLKLLDSKYKEKYIAIFILRKDEILKDPLKAVINNKKILGGLHHIYSNDLEYAKQLTAIIYHIEVDKALEIIYMQELKESLLKNDVVRFNEICNSDFIDSIFYPALSEIDSFENPILTLASMEKSTKVSSYNIEQAWLLFNNGVLKLNNENKELKVFDWQIKLIANVKDNKYLKKLLDEFFEIIDDFNVERYIDLIDKLITDLTEERIIEQLKKRKVSDLNFIKLIEYRGQDYTKYNWTVDYNSLDLYLSKLDINTITTFKNTILLPEIYEFKKYQKSLISNFRNNINNNNIGLANSILMKINETVRKNAELKDLLEDNAIVNFYHRNSNSELPIVNELIAMRIARGSLFTSSYANHFANVLTAENSTRANEISNVILKYIEYDDLLTLSSVFKTSLLYRQIIQTMFTKKDLDKTITNITKLIEKYSDIKNNLGINDLTLLTELNQWEIDKEEFNVDILNCEFIEDCLEALEYKITKDILNVFNVEFLKFKEEEYNKIFTDESNIYFKYFHLIDVQNLTQISLDVFVNKLIELIKKANVSLKWWNILVIYDSNNSNLSIINSLKDIRDQILTSSINLKIDQSLHLIPYFFKYDLLNEQKEVFRLIIKNDFLSNSDFIQLLINDSEYVKKIYTNSSQQEKEGFRNIINEKRTDNQEFENLARAINIRKTKRNAE